MKGIEALSIQLDSGHSLKKRKRVEKERRGRIGLRLKNNYPELNVSWLIKADSQEMNCFLLRSLNLFLYVHFSN